MKKLEYYVSNPNPFPVQVGDSGDPVWTVL